MRHGRVACLILISVLVSPWLALSSSHSESPHFQSNTVSLLEGWETRPDGDFRQFPPYDREQHFGSWQSHDDCFDTRALVLIRDDDDGNVEMSRRWPCTVYSGDWSDPYSGRKMQRAYKTHIDHVVALKNAYVSGAWRWSKQRRCHYANFIENNYHLLAVSAFENRSKSDSDPSEYMPKDEQFHCSYIKIWTMIKKTWDLQYSRKEKEFIREFVKSAGCGKDFFRVSRAELRRQQILSWQVADYCQ